MKEKIIEILGKNHTTPIQFNAVKTYTEVYGLYTYRNDVYVFKEGMDTPFEDLTSKEQKTVFDMVISKNWVKNKSLQ